MFGHLGIALLVIACAAPRAVAGSQVVGLTEISYAALTDTGTMEFSRTAEGRSFERALTTLGMLAVTGIPGFSDVTASALMSAQTCADAEQGALHTFADGTRRITLAAQWPSEFAVGAEPACSEFRYHAQPFRALVDAVSAAFVKQLSLAFHSRDGAPLLNISADAAGAARPSRPTSLYDMQEIVSEGRQLEHIHAYQRQGAPSSEQTVQWHIDHGLFIAFTPALLVDAEGAVKRDADGFSVRLINGTEKAVAFPPDALIFLIGDAVESIVNPKRAPGSAPLRPAPHALRVLSTAARLWYGRMFLPPPNAIDERSGRTFAQLREAAAEHARARRRTDTSDSEIDLACSAHSFRRRVGPAACADNELYCWHKCQDVTTPALRSLSATCVAKGQELACANKEDFACAPSPTGPSSIATAAPRPFADTPTPFPATLSPTATPTIVPTTAPPSTPSPSTVTPTTSAPSTPSPSTVTPTTPAPSTPSPSTVTPTTAPPSTPSPSTVTPTTAPPSTSAPSGVRPTPSSATTGTPSVSTAAAALVVPSDRMGSGSGSRAKAQVGTGLLILIVALPVLHLRA